ncbi:nuclear pore complex protein Nup50-like [Pollicipes pollicipes]|uniref:nuclear pore complex protein Nup50-like n=1 Tax=Pollicipes pollicipes TaxID=41117 RepID=UPI001884D89D|nr:nuclear pore complex protein Nup50-like [Pollicipes pollicipes]
MSKRGADKQLTHDNWDEEDSETDGQGQFQSASEEVLKKRVIKRARRRVNHSDSSGATASPFAAFSGFGTASKTADSSNPFGFLAAAKEPPSSPVASAGLCRPPLRSAGSSPASEPSRPSEYHRQLQALNRSLLSWLQTHVEKNPLCILTPVFRDYETHLQSIERRFGPSHAGGASPAASPAAGSGFSFGLGAGKAEGATTSPSASSGFGLEKAGDAKAISSPASSGFSFGKAPDAGAKPTAGSGFSFGLNAGKAANAATSSPSTGSGFSFGLPTGKAALTTSSSPPASSGFSFGLNAGKTTGAASDSVPAAAGTGGFSFGFQSGGQGGAAAPSAEAEEETEEPPVPVVSTVKEDDAVYSKRCKLFYKKDGSFVEKGVGMLYLKPCSDGKTFQCLIRADTNLGNILLNIKLNKSIPTQRMGKNNVMMACVPNPPLDPKVTSSAPVPMLVRVKTADDADELLAQLEQHKA